MKWYVKVGAMSLALFFGVCVVSGFLPTPFRVTLMLLWAMVTALLVWMEFHASSDPLARLHNATKEPVFNRQIQVLEVCYLAIESQEDTFKKYEDDSSISKAYKLIRSQIDNVVESAIKYISSYNYYSRPDPKFLNELVVEANTLSKKLNELQEYMLKIEDSTSDVDVSFVTDLLDTLKQMEN